MTTKRFQEINDKIENLKTKKNKAEGVIESIKKRWKEIYGTSDIEEIKKLKEEKKEKIKDLENKLDRISKKIEYAVDWDEYDD